eukprot:13607046-Heterocapsa_arctica.AAC.1
MLFEWACEGDSKLAQWFVDHGHAAVRLHPLQWDLRSSVHVGRVVALMQQAYLRPRLPDLPLGIAAVYPVVELAA